MRLPTNSTGFSTKRSIADELGTETTTPYFDGSSTLVTMMVPSPPWATWKSRSCSKGYEQMTSELRTKKGESSFARTSRASARGPAVCCGRRKEQGAVS